VPPDCCAVDGRVRDVVYLGATSRYVVEVAHGGRLTVLRPNVDGAPVVAHEAAPVRLVWPRRHQQPLAAAPSPGAP
jgi:putative spermidine/putrescine transport system ATP-binding protein